MNKAKREMSLPKIWWMLSKPKDGKDFDWNSGDDPYANRDPRFYRTILCNGDTWMKQTIESYEGGKDGEGTEGATKTGYYLKKYMNETVSLDPSSQ